MNDHPYPAFSKWDVCEEDPATCDCAEHSNARRAAAWRAASENETSNEECRDGCTLPRGHSGRCSNDPAIASLSAQARRIQTALDELAGMGSDICTLLAAVDKGASINIGPVGDAEGTISGAMYQNSGPRPRYETARAGKVSDVIAQLAEKWGKP